MPTKKELKLKSKELRPMVNVGKSGLTPEVVNQISTVLKKKKLLKIKLLRSFIDSVGDKTTRQIATDLAEEINANLIDVVGLVVVLARK